MISYPRPKDSGFGPTMAPPPVVGARKGEGPMDEAEVHRIVDGLIQHAISYIEDELSPDRALATDYYKGRPLGNEQTGRSQFVMTPVRDTVLAQLPDLLRVVFGPEKPVEFRPRGPEDVAAAEQATDYVNYVFSEENPGFFRTLAVLKDGLIRKTGAYKWRWDDSSGTQAYSLAGVSEEQLMILGQDPSVQINKVSPEPVPAPNAPPTFEVEVTHTYTDGCVRIDAVPPEELIFDRDAREATKGAFTIIAHRTEKSHGDLVAMGVDAADVAEHGGPDNQLRDNAEAIARRPGEATHESPEAGDANQKTRYVEAYVMLDEDGDGIAELRRICTIGPSNYVVDDEPVDEIPFALFCPDPEPHQIVGQSTADHTMDLQRLQTALVRSTLDSAAAAIFPRTWYREGYANAADILNTAIGAPIRTKAGANDVGVFQHNFMGKELLPVLELTNDIHERRTGHNKGVAGIDANALQSSTASAVTAAVTASQARTEMLARIFAEGTLKPLFRGILRLMVKYQPRKKMVRLRNQWVEIDPRIWDADMDVTVNVALGSGLTEQKIETLMAIKDEQAGILQLLGQNNPVVTIKQYRDTLATIAELRGWKDSSRFFTPITDEQVQQMQQAAQNSPPPPDPNMALVQGQLQIEHMKAKSDMEIAQQKLQLEMQKAQWEDDRLRDKQAADIQLKLRELAIEHNLDLNSIQLDAQIERERMTSQRGPNETKPRVRTVEVKRDPATGKMTGAKITEEVQEERS